jgi:hypothetical protein
MRTISSLRSTSSASTSSRALVALLTLSLAPACSSGSLADPSTDDNQDPSETTSSGSTGSSGSSGSGKAVATGGSTSGPGTGTAPAGGTCASPSYATVGGAYTDPTCVGLTLDPWTRDAEGWTVLPPVTQAGRRVIYVSAKNQGKTSTNPDVHYVTTAEAGVALLRVGEPDSLLFNRGETFHLAASLDSHGLSGGATPADAKVIGAYGTGARPILMWNQAHSIIAVESYAAQHLIITQLDLEPDPSLKQQGTGMTLSSASLAHVLVEDVKINGFQKGMDIEDGTDVVVRRSQILSSCGGYRSQGIYTQSLSGFTLDENAMDQNGLQTCGDPTSGSPEGQGVYVQSFNACFRARGNVLSRSLGNTLEARIGGDIVGNVFIGSNTALNYGLVLGGSIEGKTMPRGVYGEVSGNVFLDNQVGVQFGNTAAALFTGNVMAAAVAVQGAVYLQSQDGIGIHGLTISDNAVSAAKYFVSFQYGLPAGPVVLKNDGVNTQITNCDGAFKAADADTDGVLVFKYESTKAPVPPSTTTCYVGLEENGGDVYTDATPSTKVIDSAATGILMKPGEAPVHFAAPNALTHNNVSVTKSPFENSTTPLATNPATHLPETGDDLTAKFVNPKASIADVLGTASAFYAALAAQSHDKWNCAVTATALVPHFQAAYKPTP